MNAGQRLQEFLHFINLNAYRFEVETGLGVSSVSRLIQGKVQISGANLLKIHRKYPELNLDWLMTGRGIMIYEEASSLEPRIYSVKRLDHLKHMTELMNQEFDQIQRRLLGTN